MNTSNLKTHLFYVLLFGMGLFFVHEWVAEHDARVIADNTVKQSMVQVATLQAQINTIPAQTAAKVQTIVKVVHDAQTPAQVVAAIPSLTDLPLQTRVIPGNTVDVEVAAQPLMQLVGELKTTEVQLGACQQKDSLKDQQIVELNTTIKALKKKPNFIHRITSVAKAVGVGIGIGVLIGGKL